MMFRCNTRSLIAQRSALSKTCMIAALSLQTRRCAKDWQLRKTAGGRPVAIDRARGNAGVTLSLSHSADIVVAAAADAAPLGIDLEKNRERRFAEVAAGVGGQRESGDPLSAVQRRPFHPPKRTTWPQL